MRKTETHLKRITINPDICHGKPTIRNLRYPVENILELLSAGMTTSEILDDYPDLKEQDILACLAYAYHQGEKHAQAGVVKFLIDAQLPYRLVYFLKGRGMTPYTRLTFQEKTGH
jgi:uncharacterized protein (DUF433 family)